MVQVLVQQQTSTKLIQIKLLLTNPNTQNQSCDGDVSQLLFHHCTIILVTTAANIIHHNKLNLQIGFFCIQISAGSVLMLL